MASSERNEENLCCSQPQLLSKEKLTELLKLRGIQLTNMEDLCKDELVEIFNRVGVPLPQRKYRDNRRGRLLTESRKHHEAIQEKEKPIEERSNASSQFNVSSTSQIQSRPMGDRLKPPPDTINFERKRIKLSSTITSTSHDLDKIQIKRKKHDEIKNENCVEEFRSKLTISSEEFETKPVSNTNSNKMSNNNTKVVLKRPLSSADEKLDGSNGNEPVTKKEKKKITWP